MHRFGRINSSRFALTLGVTFILVIVVLSIIAVAALRETAIVEWRKQLANLSLVLAGKTSQELASAYSVLNNIADSMPAGARNAGQFRELMASPQIRKSMADKLIGVPQISLALIAAADGEVINSTNPNAHKRNLADRRFFQEQKNHPGVHIYTGMPVHEEANGPWMFYLSRALTDEHGEFAGVAVVGVRSDYFTEFYKEISLGPGSSISLYRDDLTLFARWPVTDSVIGKQDESVSVRAAVQDLQDAHDIVLTTEPEFGAEGALASQGLRMEAIWRLEKYPFVVVISVPDDVFLEQWYRVALLRFAVALAGSFMIGIAFFLLVRSLKQRERDMEVTERLKTEAEAASRAKSDFLAMMSHEIRTPLTAIIGFAELMSGTNDHATQADAGRTIEKNGRHLLTIINDILDISKIEAGRIVLEEIPFSPLEIVAGIESVSGTQAHAKGIEFSAVLDFPLPAQVTGDPTRWRQILINLCSNAIKFTERGSVELRLSYDAAGGMLIARVTDTGIGLNHEQIERLFQPFTQADNTIARRYGGTGLGLHVAQELARKMGGEVSVTSRRGKGSTFEVTVAAAPAQDAAWLDAIPQQQAEGAAAPQVDTLQGKVLLAEDSADNRKLISAFLGRLGIELQMAENGAQAVQKALAGNFDLVLMDIQMPVMDGIQATTILRGSGYEGPIVALTANVMAQDVAGYKSSGFTHCVGKPIDFAALARLLGELLQSRAAAVGPVTSVEDLPDYPAIKRSFERSLPVKLGRMEAGLAARDWKLVSELAHGIKGAAGTFGYPRITDLARELETAVREQNAAHADEKMQQLLALAAETISQDSIQTN